MDLFDPWDPTRQATRAGRRAAGEHPGAVLLIVAAACWFLGQPVLAVVFLAIVIVGPSLGEAVRGGWRRSPAHVQLGLASGAGVLAVAALVRPVLLYVLAPAAVIAGVWGLAVWLRARPHRKEYIEPLHEALAPVLGLDLETAPRRYLDVPEEMLEAHGGIVITLPRGLVPKPAHRDEIVSTVTTKLGLSGVRADWRLKGSDRFLRLTSKATVPLEAPFADPEIRELVVKARESRPLLALAAGDRPIAVDYDSESPHFLLACGTGLGKSALLRLLIAQALHEGSFVVILDIRRTSQRWAKGLPGVLYARTPAEIHRALLTVKAETERREEIAENFAPDEQPTWPRIVVACEEWAITQPELVEYWREIRETGDSPTTPAMRAFRRMLLAGRASKVNGLVVVQRGDAKELGGGSARAQFATRVVGRHDKPAWKLVMDDAPFVAPDKRRGHVWISLHGDITEAQVVFMSEAEAIDYATAGRPNPAGVAMSRNAGSPGETHRDGRGKPPLVAVPDPEPAAGEPEADTGRVTLPEASADKGRGLVASSYDSLRAASQRDPEFPAHLGVKRGKAWVYDAEALRRWEANRERGTRGAGGGGGGS